MFFLCITFTHIAPIVHCTTSIETIHSASSPTRMSRQRTTTMLNSTEYCSRCACAHWKAKPGGINRRPAVDRSYNLPKTIGPCWLARIEWRRVKKFDILLPASPFSFLSCWMVNWSMKYEFYIALRIFLHKHIPANLPAAFRCLSQPNRKLFSNRSSLHLTVCEFVYGE